MLQYCIDKWEENKEKLKSVIEDDTTIYKCGYDYLVKLVVRYILNDGEKRKERSCCNKDKWNEDRITIIDDGEYDGTLLFLIPRDVTSPGHWDYLQTYVEYGTCSLCDTLEGIQSEDKLFKQKLETFMQNTGKDYREAFELVKPSETQVKDYMTLCRDLICHMERPFCMQQNMEGEDITFVAEEIETGRKLEFTLLDLYGFDDESVNVNAACTTGDEEYIIAPLIMPDRDRVPQFNNRVKVRLRRVDEMDCDRIIRMIYVEMLPGYKAEIMFNDDSIYTLNMENLTFPDKNAKSVKMSEMFTEEEFMKASYTPRYIEWENGRKKSVEELYLAVSKAQCQEVVRAFEKLMKI